jgi:hypothetical protein
LVRLVPDLVAQAPPSRKREERGKAAFAYSGAFYRAVFEHDVEGATSKCEGLDRLPGDQRASDRLDDGHIRIRAIKLPSATLTCLEQEFTLHLQPGDAKAARVRGSDVNYRDATILDE